MLRRWTQLTHSEQLELELKLAVARREPDFRWPTFCYANNLRQWSLRRVFDVAYRDARVVENLRKVGRRTNRDMHDEAPRAPQTVPASLTASLLGDPLPGRSALDQDGPARLWQPTYSIAAERKASGQGVEARYV